MTPQLRRALRRAGYALACLALAGVLWLGFLDPRDPVAELGWWLADFFSLALAGLGGLGLAYAGRRR